MSYSFLPTSLKRLLKNMGNKHRDHKEKVVYYECKKFGHYKSECLDLEDKENEKQKENKKKKKF